MTPTTSAMIERAEIDAEPFPVKVHTGADGKQRWVREKDYVEADEGRKRSVILARALRVAVEALRDARSRSPDPSESRAHYAMEEIEAMVMEAKNG